MWVGGTRIGFNIISVRKSGKLFLHVSKRNTTTDDDCVSVCGVRVIVSILSHTNSGILGKVKLSYRVLAAWTVDGCACQIYLLNAGILRWRQQGTYLHIIICPTRITLPSAVTPHRWIQVTRNQNLNHPPQCVVVVHMSIVCTAATCFAVVVCYCPDIEFHPLLLLLDIHP